MSGHRGRRHLRKRVILLIEPFLEDRDGILWIKELAREYSHTRILRDSFALHIVDRNGKARDNSPPEKQAPGG